MELITEWISTYGYAGIFFLLMLGIVGLPVPDETLMVFCGFQISKGNLHPAGVLLAAVAGSWSGITVSYFLGRTLGVGVVHRFGKYMHLTDERLEKVNEWFRKAGHWALFVGYYIAGVRHFTALVAGTSRLNFPTFALYAWSGGLVWVGLFLTLGYYLGEKWQVIAEVIHRDLAWASLVLVALVAVFLLVRWQRRKSAAASRVASSSATGPAAGSAPNPASNPDGKPGASGG
jgi:membrane protein DedA with SNARE-associated domain